MTERGATELSTSPRTDALPGYRGADIDITKRTRAEEELRVNEARYRNLFENSPVALWEQDYSEIYNYCSELEQSGVTDLEEYLSKYPEELFKCANLIKIKDVNKASLTLYKAKTKVELLESINNVFTEETLPVFKESLLAIASGKKFFQSEVALQSLDKKKLFCDLTWSVSDRRVITSTLNITERKLVAEALKKSEDKYRNLFETSLVGIYRSRIEDGKVLAANSACAEIFGYDSVDSFVQDFSASKHYQDNHQREQLLHELERSGKVDGFEFTAVRKDGSNFDAAISVTIYPDKGYLEGVLFDITERKRAEEERLESESKFRSVIEQSNDAIYILFNDKFDLINNRFTEITGITVEETKAPDFNFMDSVAPKDRPLIEERSQMWERGERPPDVYEFTVVHKNGKHNQVQASVNEIDYHDYKAYLGILRDISEKKILEGQLHQAQKMESIGHLAGGIAHDFNNLLTAILGNIELIQMDLKVEDSLYLELEEIRNAAERAADLTRQLLAFSRKQVMEFKIFNLNKLISGFMRILRRTIREDVDIKTFYDNSISSIEGDPTQIEQILMNLCVNSQHAMPNGGKITIETGAVEFDEEYVRTHEGAEKGFYVMLSVSDTGTGIDSNTIDKVFDPFFTTKKVGEGTGMGLATVYGIVKQHRGTIRVYSEPGHGTTFKVYFRASEKVAGERMEANSRKAAGGFETVMVVEDNELVRKLAVRILKAHGYNVIEVSNPDEAIEVAQDKTVKLDVLLTDVIMPKMNGRELFENVAKTQLKMKVIYMSGYTKNAIAHHGVLNKGITFLQKPFTIESLIRKIQEVLEK
nr:PAS domain S-box protein [bacterium]